MPFNQLEKSAIVRLYEKYSVDFRMFGYDSQVLVISNHLLSLTTLKKPKIWHIMVMYDNYILTSTIVMRAFITFQFIIISFLIRCRSISTWAGDIFSTSF